MRVSKLVCTFECASSSGLGWGGCWRAGCVWNERLCLFKPPSVTTPHPSGPDAPFVNNYGVWVDEFEALGLRDTLEQEYPDALCFFQEAKEVCVLTGGGGGKMGF